MEAMEVLVGFFVLMFLQVHEVWLRVRNLARRKQLKERRRAHNRMMNMIPRRYRIWNVAIVALASGPLFAGCSAPSEQQTPSASAGAASPGPLFIVAQAQSATAASVPPAPTSDRPIGLPRARDYEPNPELRAIYFDFGKLVMRPDDMKIVDANAAWLRAHPDYLVLIEGHSDSRGTTNKKNEFNMDLGERRAHTAENHLIAQGVEPNRITILSYGQERPQCAEQSERCWSQNRRSRFLVKPR
jgi:peptidoglycan-associated lipoprotein